MASLVQSYKAMSLAGELHLTRAQIKAALPDASSFVFPDSIG